MIEFLELGIASRKIDAYRFDIDEVASPEDAPDIVECEKTLALGIAAFQWMDRASTAIAEGAAEELIELTPEIEAAERELYLAWLRPCQAAKDWIARCAKNGYRIRNEVEFAHCQAAIEAWLERDAHYQLSKKAREERFSKEPW